jgi:hypothetical protein
MLNDMFILHWTLSYMFYGLSLSHSLQVTPISDSVHTQTAMYDSDFEHLCITIETETSCTTNESWVYCFQPESRCLSMHHKNIRSLPMITAIWDTVPYSVAEVSLMEAVCTSELPVHFKEITQRRYIQRGCHLHTQCHENLKFHIRSLMSKSCTINSEGNGSSLQRCALQHPFTFPNARSDR